LEGSAATRVGVLGELARVDRFHFAGHATYDVARSWESALHMADGTALRPGDILSLSRSPATVVLSGCDTATTRPTRVADMSLARAFLLAGAETVVASSRPVDDKLAAELVSRAYELEGSAQSFGDALRAAQIELAEKTPDVDWAAYRVITR
jgi:CHAT domain-containing protein